MMKSLSHVILVAGVLAGCASPSIPAARFQTAPPVTTVNDRLDTPESPEPRVYVRALVHIRGSVIRPIKRALSLPRDQRALGVNSLDEVPDSTWFTNRIGVRDMSVEEVRTGADEVGTPEAHLPWTVLSTKVGGANIGFIITDARGEKFILKFDKLGFPETETGADAIIGRLLWASGYNVPEDHVVYFRPSDLVLSPKAKVKDVFGNARPLVRAELDRLLTLVDVGKDGRIRGLTSRMLAGTWLGGHPGEGTRADDPNDRIPHEHRRDLRGSFAIFGWLDHTDIKEDNYLDMFVTDPVTKRRYVKHYMVDFGSGLGSTARTNRDLRPGHEYIADFPSMLTSFMTLGLHQRDWEHRHVPAVRGVGLYDAAPFSPAAWKPNNATYLPFLTADRFDNFWGAKILIKFTPAQLRAVVETGRFSDPAATDYLTRTLIQRQRVAARYWFSKVAPIDRPEVVQTAAGYTVCFDDLLLTNRLAAPGTTTRYTISTHDRSGAKLASHVVWAAKSGRTCTQPLSLGTGKEAYTIAEIRTTRPGLDASTYVHVGRDAGALKVVGIWRR